MDFDAWVNSPKTFKQLYDHLAGKMGSDDSDLAAWEYDLSTQFDLTMACLSALIKSWARGGNGYLTTEDWQ
jgi:hypothetical protein